MFILDISAKFAIQSIFAIKSATIKIASQFWETVLRISLKISYSKVPLLSSAPRIFDSEAFNSSVTKRSAFTRVCLRI